MAVASVFDSLKTPPMAPGYPLVGTMLDLRDDPMAYMMALKSEYGDIVGMRVAGGVTYMVTHPDGIQVILQDNHRNYHKQVFNYELLYPLVGQGLLTSNGDFWRRQRRLAQPAFHRKRIEGFASMMVQEAEALCRRWE